MNALGQAFRAHVANADIADCTITQQDDDHLILTTDHAVGRVSFYELEEGSPEIVELSVIDPDAPTEPKFFLHFELVDEPHAEELFDEMTSTLQERDLYDTTRVLLCCTAGLTTTMFASKLQETAHALSLDYAFEALPLEQAKAEGGDFDVVLLAPQISYQRKEVVGAFPEAAVVQIPPKVFATLDVGACLKMVMHLLADNTAVSQGQDSAVKLVRDLASDERIMVIVCIQRPKNSWYGWRIYDHGSVIARGSVTKANPAWRDIEDLIATLPVRGWNVRDLDAIGIAVPGIVNQGSVAFSGHWAYGDYDLGRVIAERYGVKVFVDNNANAAAVGCYVSQDVYDSVVIHSQQTGYLVGGQGIVVDGNLIKGRISYAGELTPLYNVLYGTDRGSDRAWTSEGMLEIVARMLTADISLVAPDAIYVAVDLLDDMDALREKIAEFFGDKAGFIPDLFHVEDYRELLFLGELALCLRQLRTPRPLHLH